MCVEGNTSILYAEIKTLQKTMDGILKKAAEEGDTSTLYAEIKSDPFVLDKIDSIPFTDSPFHIAALAGQTHFALEIMILKPSLARKLNYDGYSLMHLAVLNRHEQLVRGLLAKDKELVRIAGKEGRTPLHYMAATGWNPRLLDKMLSACADSVEDLTVRRETALHLAVKNNQNEAAQVLVDFIKSIHKEEIYWLEDEQGCTVLHYASMGGQFKLMKSLRQVCRSEEWNLGVGTKNANGQTALDIAEALPVTDINRERLLDILKVRPPGRCLGFPYGQIILAVLKLARKIPRESRDALLVVLAIVNTTSFQHGINPAGGFWQDNGISDQGKRYFAGTPILATTSPVLYTIISFFTLVGFVISSLLICVLTWGMPIKLLLLLSMVSLACGYLLAFIAITRKVVWIIVAVLLLTALWTLSASWLYVSRLKTLRSILRKRTAKGTSKGTATMDS